MAKSDTETLECAAAELLYFKNIQCDDQEVIILSL